MSEYREKLQNALIARRRAGGCPPYQRFYSVCGAVACAAFLSGWLLAIVSHF